MNFTINGCSHEVELDNRTSLLDLLRDHLGFAGTKKGCDQGDMLLWASVDDTPQGNVELRRLIAFALPQVRHCTFGR